MSSEDQERFEDYLELERYIEELQAGHMAHPPEDVTPMQARVYQMAALFRSLSPDAELRPEFAEQLKERLLALDAEGDTAVSLPHVHEEPVVNLPHEQSEVEQPEQPQASPHKQVERRRVSFFSRRALLTGGAVAAASLAIGASAEHLIEHKKQTTPPANVTLTNTPAPTDTDTPITTGSEDVAIASNIATQWLLVTTLEALGTGAVRFVTDSVIGYVVSVTADGNAQQADNIIALSAACTHKGCIVRWQDADRLFHCPCHSGLFDASGTFVSTARYRYTYPALPRLNIKIKDNKVYVEVPA